MVTVTYINGTWMHCCVKYKVPSVNVVAATAINKNKKNKYGCEIENIDHSYIIIFVHMHGT